ncbi:hypothetical protein MAR_012345 [Mya arenaria]|uniref:Uncharacterized protein n=1 Tax=Mya arenaria TaxID=6604 RepID=A0ABY7G0P6_MYAAR|nr:hypothetical protein MAR_012345 [Mya arenaria]
MEHVCGLATSRRNVSKSSASPSYRKSPAGFQQMCFKLKSPTIRLLFYPREVKQETLSAALTTGKAAPTVMRVTDTQTKQAAGTGLGETSAGLLKLKS